MRAARLTLSLYGLIVADSACGGSQGAAPNPVAQTRLVHPSVGLSAPPKAREYSLAQ